MGTHRSVSRCAEDVVESSFFSRAVTLSNAIDNSQNVVTYGECPQKAYKWRTWTDARSVRVICIRFHIQGVHRFKSP
jgi:hypothetical protein